MQVRLFGQPLQTSFIRTRQPNSGQEPSIVKLRICVRFISAIIPILISPQARRDALGMWKMEERICLWLGEIAVPCGTSPYAKWNVENRQRLLQKRWILREWVIFHFDYFSLMLKCTNDDVFLCFFEYYRIFRKTVEVYVCKTNCSDSSTPCIQKCCAPNEVYSLGEGGKKRGCIPLGPEDTPFNPPLYKNIQTKLSETELQSVTPHLLQQYPPKFQYKCYKNVTLVFPYSSDVVQLMSPLAQINLE